MKRFAIPVLLLCLTAAAMGGEKPNYRQLLMTPKSDVFMQGFYWNTLPGGVWYDSLAKIAPHLASAGFGAIWFPPPEKGASGAGSMGYDPYDHFDLGEFDQQSTIATRFGTKDQLVNSIQAYHNVGIQVFCDAVMNQMNGGEQSVPVSCKPYPAYRDSDALIFNYPRGSHRFLKNAASFYPNVYHCDVTPPYHGADNPAFQFGIWLDKDQQSIKDSLVVWGQWLKNAIGYDGFRIDAVKNVDPNFVGYWLSHANSGGYAVAEDFSDAGSIVGWLNQALTAGGGNLAMFDFPLRFELQKMCNQTDGSYDMRNLDGAGVIAAGASGYHVATFVENHDLDRIGYDNKVDSLAGGHNPIVSDKDLAYAFTIFSEGRPCVFYRDYFNYGLARQIDSLIWIRQHYLAGGTTKRSGLNPWYIRQDGSTDQNGNAWNIYVARRDGYGGVKPALLVINSSPSQYMDVWVNSGLPGGTVMKDYGPDHDVNKPVQGDGRVDLWCKPRSWAIYIADTTSVNHPPAIQHVPAQLTYTNAAFSYQTYVIDADNDPVSYSLTNSPGWLAVSSAGRISGTPAYGDTGTFQLIVNVQDSHGATTSDTSSIHIVYNRPPHLAGIRDTTVRITVRYQYQSVGTDPDNDTLYYSFTRSPGWLNVGQNSGIISGTPGIGDVGTDTVSLAVTDGKGGWDTTKYILTVTSTHDTVIATYGKPTIDGAISIASSDWASNWKICTDSPTDSKWWKDSVTADNELYGIYSTWDADSLYLGVDYLCNDKNNTFMLYISAGLPNGWTNFHDTTGHYKGSDPKNNRFRPQDAPNFFIADYFHDTTRMYRITGDTTQNMYRKFRGVRGAGGRSVEVAVAWDNLFGLGSGLVPPHVQLKMVALLAGGYNWGSGDAAPDNPDVNGDRGPDSLINFVSVFPDTNGDGIPDPTVYIDSTIVDTTHTPPTPTTVQATIAYQQGWNLLSIPLKMSDFQKSTLFPGNLNQAYSYDSMYRVQTVLQNNLGYWLKFGSPQSQLFTGYDRPRDTVTVTTGWNLIGTLNSPILKTAVTQQPPNIVNSSYFYYDAGYRHSDTLKAGKGYWVKTTGPGKLLLVKP